MWGKLPMRALRLRIDDPEERQRLLRNGAYVVLLVAFILSGTAIIAYEVLVPPKSQVALVEGQAAPSDILAPRSLKYESDVLTQAKRDAAVAAVRPVYDPPDPAVLNEQLQLARQILDYVENVRYDDFATMAQKMGDIEAITALDLSSSVTESLLRIEDEAAWRAIDAQVIRLLERVLSGEVRDDNIQARQDNLPNLISASYSETEVQIVTGIVSDLIRANTFYNEELTRQQQTQAADDVPVEVRTFITRQMIIREGEIATAAHIEALEQFDLLRVTERRADRFVGGLLAMTMVTVLGSVYIRRFHPQVYHDPSFMVVLGMLFLAALASARVIDSDSHVLPYYYPASALAFLVTTLVSPQLAIVFIMALAWLAGIMTGDSLEFAVVIGIGGVMGVLNLGQIELPKAYFRAGFTVIFACVGVALVFALGGDETVDFFTLFWQIVGSLVNGLLSAGVALVGLYVTGSMLNIPTSLKIAELSQANHPLLQRLLREAPGTYQHSLQVANLAEQGAQQVDANASLLRVAAMYHDVGKILNPHFFIENQMGSINPHDVLDNPVQSARIIIGHITEGERLARRHRLPARLRDFIMEHHGTTQVMFFYQKAQKRSGDEVNIEDFTYPGPRPQSRETAILMLADGCETSVRARQPQNKDEVCEMVDYIFEARLQGGQLDDSGLTLSDLHTLRETFIRALQGIFHTRIVYPDSPGQPVKLPEKPAEALTSGSPVEASPPGDAAEAESESELATEPVAESEVESVAAEPVAESEAEPVAEPTTEATVESETEPTTVSSQSEAE